MPRRVTEREVNVITRMHEYDPLSDGVEAPQLSLETRGKRRVSRIKTEICEHPSCDRVPSFGVAGTTRRLRCRDHSLPDDVNVIGNTREHPTCHKQSTFAPRGTTRALRCRAHSLPGDVDVVNSSCHYTGCHKHAAYVPFSVARRHCSDHREQHDVFNPTARCKYRDIDTGRKCREYASHATRDQCRIRTHCRSHATPEMVDHSRQIDSELVTTYEESLSDSK